MHDTDGCQWDIVGHQRLLDEEKACRREGDARMRDIYGQEHMWDCCDQIGASIPRICPSTFLAPFPTHLAHHLLAQFPKGDVLYSGSQPLMLEQVIHNRMNARNVH